MNRIVLTLIYCFLFHTALPQVPQDTLPPSNDTIVRSRSGPDTPVRRVPVPRQIAPRQIDSSNQMSITPAVVDSPTIENVARVNLAGALNQLLQKHPYYSFYASPVTNIAIARKDRSKDVFFYVLLGLFFYFALLKTLFRKYINNLVSIFLRITLRQQQLREQLLQTPLPSLMLNIFFLLTGGLYASMLLDYYQYRPHPNFWIQTLYCVGILALIYAGKFVILKFTGWVFNLSKATDTYIFIVFLVNKMLGMLLLPFLVLIAFYSGQPQQVFVTLSLILILVLFVYRFIFSFGPIRAEIKVNPFHFFLYLCAFEIAPLLLIYKVLLAILETSK